MTPWVHLFSKFTSEALLFEAAFICLLIGSYLAYLVIKKKRHGAVTDAVPSSVVKSYLNDLITDAEHLRSQLFGLLESSGITPGAVSNSDAERAAELAARHSDGSGLGAKDSELLHQISALEARMKDQSRAMDLLVQEKSRIEGELFVAKSTGSAKGAGSLSSSSPESETLRKKIFELENKLSEYSVIEDDLANLKRLQQENSELRNRLTGTAVPEPAPVVKTPTEETKPADSDLLAEFEKMLQG